MSDLTEEERHVLLERILQLIDKMNALNIDFSSSSNGTRKETVEERNAYLEYSKRMDKEREANLRRWKTIDTPTQILIPYGRPKTFQSATLYHSPSMPIRRRLGHMG